MMIIHLIHNSTIKCNATQRGIIYHAWPDAWRCGKGSRSRISAFVPRFSRPSEIWPRPPPLSSLAHLALPCRNLTFRWPGLLVEVSRPRGEVPRYEGTHPENWTLEALRPPVFSGPFSRRGKRGDRKTGDDYVRTCFFVIVACLRNLVFQSSKIVSPFSILFLAICLFFFPGSFAHHHDEGARDGGRRA